MFNDLVESSVARDSTRKPWTVTLSVIAQIFLLGVLVLIPLLYTQALPKAMLNVIMMAPAPPPAAAPPAARQNRTPRTLLRTHASIFRAPQAIPPHVDMNREDAPPEVDANVAVGVPGGVPDGSPDGVIGGSNLTGAVPPAPPALAPPPQRIRQGGTVQAAMLISQPMPAYPPLARQARIQGNVVLHAIISKDGRVEQLSVISGHPLLIQAALDAVRQWRYHPTLLNNDPVEVDTTITVTFTMGGN